MPNADNRERGELPRHREDQRARQQEAQQDARRNPNTRDDGRKFLREAASIPVITRVTTFHLDQVNEALDALKNDAIKGAGVLVP